MPDYPVVCHVCGQAFDSMDSVADSMAMLRDHEEQAHSA